MALQHPCDPAHKGIKSCAQFYFPCASRHSLSSVQQTPTIFRRVVNRGKTRRVKMWRAQPDVPLVRENGTYRPFIERKITPTERQEKRHFEKEYGLGVPFLGQYVHVGAKEYSRDSAWPWSIRPRTYSRPESIKNAHSSAFKK